jgi:NAD(P)H dehydrogenase (quinone)
MSKLFILGATGHLGGLTVKHLLNQGVNAKDIVAVVRDTNKASDLEKLGLEVRLGDYDQKDFSPAVFEGADKLLFISSPSFDNTHRIKQHATVVEAARDANVKHIVYTGLAYPDRHNTPLAYVHSATEAAIKSTGIPYTILRNTFYMEYFLVKAEMERAIASGTLLTASNGEKLNLVSRNDFALAAAIVLTTEGHENTIYELTYPVAYSYEDIARILSKLSGKQIAHKDVAIEQLKAHLLETGLTPEQLLYDSSAFQPAFANGWASVTSDSLVNLIGRNNLTTIEEAVRKLL